MLRLMDVNLDRLSEGLRVLEDVARFVLNDAPITERLKRLRHEMIPSDPALERRLLAARNSESDIGRQSPVPGIERRGLEDLVMANARRAQESLRVLEEFSKLPDIPLEIAGRDFERARFDLYEIERELVFRLLRNAKQESIRGLYVIIDAETLVGRLTPVEAARQAIAGGAEILQYRDKIHARREMVSIARELRDACARSGVLFLVNDWADIALAVEADGVHLGQEDLPVGAVRKMLPPGMIIGCSVRTIPQAQEAEAEGADYLGVGSIYSSPTKPGAEVIGLAGLRAVKGAASVPVVAIGGITERNVREVIGVGADAVAVIGAVLKAADLAGAVRRLKAMVERALIEKGETSGKVDFRSGTDRGDDPNELHRQT